MSVKPAGQWANLIRSCWQSCQDCPELQRVENRFGGIGCRCMRQENPRAMGYFVTASGKLAGSAGVLAVLPDFASASVM